MMVKLFGANPSDLASSSSCSPNQPVAEVVPGRVTEMKIPGLSCWMICAAPSS